VRPETEAAVAVHPFGAARIRPPRLG